MKILAVDYGAPPATRLRRHRHHRHHAALLISPPEAAARCASIAAEIRAEVSGGPAAAHGRRPRHAEDGETGRDSSGLRVRMWTRGPPAKPPMSSPRPATFGARRKEIRLTSAPPRSPSKTPGAKSTASL